MGQHADDESGQHIRVGGQRGLGLRRVHVAAAEGEHVDHADAAKPVSLGRRASRQRMTGMIRDTPDGHGCVALWRFYPGVARAASPERAAVRVVVPGDHRRTLRTVTAHARSALTAFDHSGSFVFVDQPLDAGRRFTYADRG